MQAPDFWANQESANKLIKQLKRFKDICSPFFQVDSKIKEMQDFVEIFGEDDESSLLEIQKDINDLGKTVNELEFNTLVSGEFDKCSAILSINAGAGGTESCDWVSMLLRMYTRYCESCSFKVSILDILPGEEAGVKNVTMSVEGDYAFGYLKSEIGVHRLVRISPFDSNKRRHTSFASVDVVADVGEDIDIKIEEKDLKIDVYRSGGAGGQSVNTTDSAVRMTHIPTGIVVQCQNERSQLKNKSQAIKVLKARLFELEQKKLQEKRDSENDKKMDISWGSQIRSYVFCPYQMVKDHRTDVEVGNVNAVMDGEIDPFVQAYLKKKAMDKK